MIVLVDGLQLSTPATIGNGMLKVLDECRLCVIAIRGEEWVSIELRPQAARRRSPIRKTQ
ncbi:MAG TPA: hypothetical protein EYP53_09890 [Candidatus Latescibacteria bacterium]|nr:hypothetical protein [Candidatus Latescibacterota bacterium]